MRHRDDTGEKLHRIVVNRSTNDKVRSVGCQPLGQKRRLLSEPPRLQASSGCAASGRRAYAPGGGAKEPGMRWNTPGKGGAATQCARLPRHAHLPRASQRQKQRAVRGSGRAISCVYSPAYPAPPALRPCCPLPRVAWSLHFPPRHARQPPASPLPSSSFAKNTQGRNKSTTS